MGITALKSMSKQQHTVPWCLSYFGENDEIHHFHKMSSNAFFFFRTQSIWRSEKITVTALDALVTVAAATTQDHCHSSCAVSAIFRVAKNKCLQPSSNQDEVVL